MTTVGKSIDHPKAKGLVDKYFVKVESLSVNKAISPRIRFKLKDVIDLRKNEWIPKRPNVVPKTIEEVHRDAVLEKLDKERKMVILARESRDRMMMKQRSYDEDEEDEDEFLPPVVSIPKKRTSSQTSQHTQSLTSLPTLPHISILQPQTPQQTQPLSTFIQQPQTTQQHQLSPTLQRLQPQSQSQPPTLQRLQPQSQSQSPTLQRLQPQSQSHPQLPTQELLQCESPRNLTTSNAKNKQSQDKKQRDRHSCGRRKPQSPPSSPTPKYQYVVSSRDITKTPHLNSSPVYIKKSERHTNPNKESPSTQYKEVR